MILQQLNELKSGKKGIAWLVDPDKCELAGLQEKSQLVAELGIDLILVGGSLLFRSIEPVIRELKKSIRVPVIIFPGSAMQISREADGILLLSLISGRNADYLIGQHVVAAPILADTQLEILPTGYILVEGGSVTTVQYISNTKPIPKDKPELAMATALAGAMLGLSLIYLDAGSGALAPVPANMIREVSSAVNLPVIVGGGIRTPGEAEKAWQAGADLIVVGNAAETRMDVLTEIVAVRNRFNS